MIRGISLFLLLAWYGTAKASGEWTVQGGRSAGMGQTSVAISDCWSANNNQAGMAFLDNNKVGFFFENRFLMKALSVQSLCFNYKMHTGTLGATLRYTGDAVYNSTKAGLGYALVIGHNVSAGVQLDYLGTYLGQEYGKSHKVTFEAGVMVKLNQQLTFGVHSFNAIHAKQSGYGNEAIPTTMNFGFGYTGIDKFLLTAEVYKNSEFPMELRTGAEYRLNQVAYARIGLCSNPARYTFGFGIEKKKIVIDIASSVHQQLGYSPQISFQYSF